MIGRVSACWHASGHWLPVCLLVAFAIPPIPSQSVAQQSSSWLTGRAREEQLCRPLTATWSGPLGQVLEQIARTQQISLFLDRRVDPGQRVDVQANRVSVFEAIQILLESCELSGCWIGDVYYIAAPRDVGQLLLNRNQMQTEIRRLSGPIRRQLVSRSTIAWPRLSQPSDLLNAELAGGRLIDPVPELPHDLWDQFAGPALPAIDRLFLLVHGFGKRPALNPDGSGSLQLVDQLVDASPVNFRFRIPASRDYSRAEILAKIGQAFPESGLRDTSGSVSATTTPAMIARIQQGLERIAWSIPPGQNTDPSGTQVVSVDTRASLGQILATAAARLNVELQFGAELREQLEEQIDLKVRDVSYRELIEQALSGSGLTYDLDDKNLTIRRK